MKKKCKIIILPTEDKNAVVYMNNYHELTDSYKGTYTPQHLYLISDDEIKEGDWVIANGKLGKYSIDEENRTHDVASEEGIYPFKDCQYIKKVIASTDNLRVYDDECEMPASYRIPKFSEDFIKAYVKANGKIDEVMVEYTEEKDCWRSRDKFDTIEVYSKEDADKYICIMDYYPSIPKLRDDNTVIISEAKTMYSRDEVENLVKKALFYGVKHQVTVPFTIYDVNKWIKENL